MPAELEQRLAEILGTAVRRLGPLSGGCVGEVYRAELANGDAAVVKVDRSGESALDREGFMLSYLAEHSNLPVPRVRHCTAELLVMDFLEGDSRFSPGAERHAADLLAACHGVRAEQYGLERDTLIGSLHQPNTWTDSWIDFFRKHRLLHMARQAKEEGRFRAGTLKRIEKFAEHLDQWLLDPEHPSLLHGDVWTTNVLARDDRITGFIDPAVYYGHPEIELAFITLFGTFGEAFFERYHEQRPIADGFFEERRDIYNLYPLLVHVRLFGGGYLSGVERVLSRHGF